MKERIIKTNTTGKKAREILGAVIGQMSDGMFEGVPYYDGYWMFVNIDDDNSICIDQTYYVDRWDRRYINKFYGMTDKAIKEFFAKMIKRIVQEELRDNNISVRGQFKRGNMRLTQYLNYYEDVTIDDCVEVYDVLMGE